MSKLRRDKLQSVNDAGRIRFDSGRIFLRSEDGGVSLEAALVLPFFVAFVLALQALIQIGVAQIALRSAVSETVKDVSGRLYPVQLLYQEAQDRIGQTKAASVVSDVLYRVEQARSTVQEAENQTERLASFIPEPVVELIRLEKQKREQIEDAGLDAFERTKAATFDKAVNQALSLVVYHYANHRRLKKEKLHVTAATLPDWDDRLQAKFGVVAEYEVSVSLPFFHRKVILKERALERAWLDTGR